MLSRHSIDICCIQEVRWSGGSARVISCKNTRYKFFWMGNDEGLCGVGILIKEELIENVVEVICINDRIIMLKLSLAKSILNVQCMAHNVD